MGTGMNASVNALAELPGGDLIAGGDFYNAGAVPASRIARRSGSTWFELGVGTNGTVRALLVLPGGDLIAGGDFTTAGLGAAKNIARWDGFSWWPLGAGIGTGFVGTRVQALAVLANDDLVVGGDFSTAGGIEAEAVARWDGTSWHSMGQDLGPFRGPGLDDQVWALAVMPNGDVIAGGDFGNGTGLSPAFIARWNGSTWQSMGSGMNSTVYALLVMPNGDLIAGGEFTSPASHIARWNGSAWSSLGSGVGGGQFPTVHALAVGPAGELYAAGDFSIAGGSPANRIARWNGSTWSPMGGGLGLHVFSWVPAIKMLSSGELVAAGGFITSSGQVSATLSTWGCGPNTCYANCDGSTVAPVLNVGDFTCFLQRFAAADPYANCDGSTTQPVLNVGDFTCFLQRFAAGCP
jgi:trimeric autotransporter adhesin